MDSIKKALFYQVRNTGFDMKVWVNTENKKWKNYKIDFEKIANSAYLSNNPDAEVSITLIDDKTIHKINKKYRNIDKPTNVLSFELGDDVLLGDIFISLDTVAKEAKGTSVSIEEHTAHMIVHGMLHLQGYDHLTDKQAKVMEGKEIKILKRLGYKNPYKTESVIKKYLLFMVLGAITSFGFAPFNLWFLSLLGVGLAYYIVTKQTEKQSFIKSLLSVSGFGFAYGVCMFWWILHSIYVIPELTTQFAIWTVPALLGIGVVCGIIFSIPFAVLSYFQNKTKISKQIIFAISCSLVLWLREWVFTGFPWNPFSNITLPSAIISNSMAIWGALGLTFVITGFIASAVELFKDRKQKQNIFFFLVFVGLFIFGYVCGYNNIKKSEQSNTESAQQIRIVQPAKTAIYKGFITRDDMLKQANEKLRDLFVLATNNTDSVPDIIVFPETTFPFGISNTTDLDFARILNTNTVIGANLFVDNKMYNSMLITDKNGKITNVYSKSHLVPFGEYRPFGDIIKTPGQLSAGDGKTTITINTQRGEFNFAPAICYEIIFSDSLTQKNEKIDAIINITNDTWFGKTPGTFQHLDMVRRYAIESGLPIVRADYSGISAFVSASGKIVSFLPIGHKGNLDGYVYGAHNTLYRTVGRDLMMVIILIFSIIASMSISVFPKKD